MREIRGDEFSPFVLTLLLFIAALVSGCAATKANLDPVGNIDGRYKNEQKSYALICANYKVQKKYDLLEERLLEKYDSMHDTELSIGKLFSVIDLAEFYTYGFVNYKKALTFFNEAGSLNRRINKSNLKYDKDDDTIVTHYIASGKYLIPRGYSFKKIEEQVSSGYRRINRIFKHQTIAHEESIKLPLISTLVTSNYAFAIRVERDILPPSYFYKFEELLSQTTRDYFKRRHKLQKSAHSYYIAFNIVHGLATVFDFSSLSSTQIETVLGYLGEARKKRLNETSDLEFAYLDFVEVLCLTELGRIDRAIEIFEVLQQKIVSINDILSHDLELLKERRNNAASIGRLKTVGFLALTVITMSQAAGSGGGTYINLTPAGLMDFSSTVGSLQRKLEFTGESTHAKQWGILLDIDDQLQLLRAVGKSHHLKGDLKKSILYNEEAVKIISNLRSTITTEEGRVSFAGYRDTLYARLIKDLFRLGKYEEAFFYAENSRARALVDLIGSKLDISFGDKKLDDYVKRVKDIQVYRDQIRGDVGVTDQQVSYVNDLEGELSQSRSHLHNQGNSETIGDTNKKTTYKELLSLITVDNLSHGEIQEIIPPESTLIEYFVGKDTIYAWVLDNKEFHAIDLHIDPKLVKRDVIGFIDAINTDPFSRRKAIKPQGEKLFEKLFEPLTQHITNRKIYLVTHGFLHHLPFDALYSPNGFLVEKYAFVSLPSSSLLQFIHPLPTKLKSILALGNPTIDKTFSLIDLPGAEFEVKKIANLFIDKKVAIKKQATESLFRSQSADYQISHFAGHAIFDEQDPLNSKLYLANDEQNDGMLSSKELYELPKVSELIILSACETAKNKIGAGDELIGLLRGFFFSGASSIVATLWVVDDLATQQLMEKFYHHMIKDNKSPIDALQKAKQELIISDQYSSPFFWSSFNLYGLGI